MKPAELAATAGVPLLAAERIVAARYVGTLFVQEKRRSLTTPKAAGRALPPELFSAETEYLYALILDSQHGLKACVLLGKGGSTGVALQLREVLTPILRLGAVSFILAHNHPSGDPTPSREDIAMTKRIAAGAELLGITLLDHLIVARGTLISLFELGLVPESREQADPRRPQARAPSP